MFDALLLFFIFIKNCIPSTTYLLYLLYPLCWLLSYQSFIGKRRKRDSNPWYKKIVRWFSKPMPSATQPFLHALFVVSIPGIPSLPLFWEKGWKGAEKGWTLPTAIQYSVGDDRTRTDDFMRAKHAFYQLNYTPFYYKSLKLSLLFVFLFCDIFLKGYNIYLIHFYLSLTLGFPFLSLEDPNDIQKSLNKGIQPFPKVFQGKQSFPNKNTIWNKKYLFKKKNHFETKSIFSKNGWQKKNLFLFAFFVSKRFFFCQPFFEKIQTLCRVPPFKKVFFFVNHFLSAFHFSIPFRRKGRFSNLFQRSSKGNPLFRRFSKGFPKENLCPFLFFGTGAENLCPFLFTPFRRKGVKRKVFRRKTYKRGEKGWIQEKGWIEGD